MSQPPLLGAAKLLILPGKGQKSRLQIIILSRCNFREGPQFPIRAEPSGYHSEELVNGVLAIYNVDPDKDTNPIDKEKKVLDLFFNSLFFWWLKRILDPYHISQIAWVVGEEALEKMTCFGHF